MATNSGCGLSIKFWGISIDKYVSNQRLRHDLWDLLQGRSVSIWLTERYRVLKEGMQALEEELKGRRVQKTQVSTTHQPLYFKPATHLGQAVFLTSFHQHNKSKMFLRRIWYGN